MHALSIAGSLADADSTDRRCERCTRVGCAGTNAHRAAPENVAGSSAQATGADEATLGAFRGGP
eukprot:1204360-Alexandrium_andersonii.AAC.1